MEAARLMYEEGVSQYFDAKHMAARRLLGRKGSKRLRYRPQDLPSNGEIQRSLRQLADQVEGAEHRAGRLLAMRTLALEIMGHLAPFEPRLIGSVSTGHARRGSDIDLHVFTDDLGPLEAHLDGLGWRWTRKRVTIRVGNHFEDYHHIHIDARFPVELSIYERSALRITQRSSTDGRPIVRLKATALASLIDESRRAGIEDWDDGEEGGYTTLYDVENLSPD